MRSTRTRGWAIALGVGLVVTLGIAVRGSLAAADVPQPMTVAQTEATLTAYLDALHGGGSAHETYFADDVVVTLVGSGQQVTGPAAANAAIDGLHRVTFDAHLEIKEVVVGAGRAAVEADFVGTQTGEFAGIAPTGKVVNVPYSVFYELSGGKITALRIYGLVDGLVQQLQAEPTPAESAGEPAYRYRPGQPHFTAGA